MGIVIGMLWASGLGFFSHAAQDRPCAPLLEACRAAGFAGKKGMIPECLKPILEGTPVPGVKKIPPESLAACRERQERGRERRRMKRERSMKRTKPDAAPLLTPSS